MKSKPVKPRQMAGVAYLTPAELSARWDGAVGVRTLANWRSAKPQRGPAYTRIGRSVRYTLPAILRFEAANAAKFSGKG